MDRTRKLLSINNLLWLLFYLLVFSFALFVSFHYFDHDFPWHLRIGEQITREKAVPTVDYYNLTMQGKTFIDHEWLFNWLFYNLYEKSGYILLNVFFAAAFAAIFFALNFLTSRFYIEKHLPSVQAFSRSKFMASAMLCESFAMLAMKPFYGVRMQIAGNLFFLILLILLELWNRKKKQKYLFFLIPLFIAWANLHGSFLIGMAIMWGYYFCHLALKLLAKTRLSFFAASGFSQRQLATAFSFFLASSASTLLNPYGAKLYAFLKTYGNTSYMNVIMEWRPFYHLPVYYDQVIIMAIFISVLLISSFIFISEKGSSEIKKRIAKPDLWHWSLALLFLFLSFKSKRHFPLFFITAFPLIIQFVYFEFASAIKLPASKRRPLLAKSAATGFLAFSVFYFASRTDFVNDPFSKSYSPFMPYDLVSYLKGNVDFSQARIFNDYSFGGFFLWTIPQAKIFIDGRMPQADYGRHTLIEEYMDFYKEGRADEMLKKHKINTVILQKEADIQLNGFEEKFLKLDENKINRTPNYLRDYLGSSKEWKKVYEDEIGEVYSMKN